MANPQKENGYLALAREIQDAFCRTRIRGEVRQVVDVVIRQTYGYKRKEDRISLDFFCEKTAMPKPTVCRAIKDALEMNLIIKNDNEHREASTYQFNKDFEKWRPLSKKIIKISLSKLPIVVDKNDNERPLTLYVSKENTKTVRTSRTVSTNKRFDDETPQSLEEFVKLMRESPQRHIQVLGEYADTKKLKHNTKGQWREFFSRNIKAAARLSKYSDHQIATAYEEMKKDLKTPENPNPKAFISKWGIETLEKYLDK